MNLFNYLTHSIIFKSIFLKCVLHIGHFMFYNFLKHYSQIPSVCCLLQKLYILILSSKHIQQVPLSDIKQSFKFILY